MIVSELIRKLQDYLKKNPDWDRDIFWMQLDIAATKENISIKEQEEMLVITNDKFTL